MAQSAAQTVQVDFVKSEGGWIIFTIRTAKEIIEVWASHALDPFPGMIRWLEDLSNGQIPCRFGVDDDSSMTLFEAWPVQDDPNMVRLSVRGVNVMGWEDEETVRSLKNNRLETLVDPQELVREFYRKFQIFTHSRFVPEEWAAIRLGEALHLEFPDFHPEQLEQWDEAGTREFIQEKLIPRGLQPPDGLETMGLDELRDFVLGCLRGFEGAFDGEDLRTLTSPQLEALLVAGVTPGEG